MAVLAQLIGILSVSPRLHLSNMVEVAQNVYDGVPGG